ncbi:hypothetical protein ACTD5D_22160 [Nocardia takedensis]|uniref:hypothetical protein n=1 Tax=Nocardia takedensis TaxID=259390 RepID=UPI0006846869|nr:hypothetical protein [Nocardia takedensis]
MNDFIAEPAPPAELCDRLRAAADRLLAGTPLHSDGKLTILSLAQEAGIKRWLLTHKYPHHLKGKYQAEFKAADHKSRPLQAAEHDLEHLRTQLRTEREQRRHFEQLARTYAIIIGQLADELADTAAERDAFQAASPVTQLPRPAQRP